MKKKMSSSEKNSLSKSPDTRTVLPTYNVTEAGQIYYVIVEKLVFKLNEIEYELRCAWKILDILNQECIKMWEKLEKLDYFLYNEIDLKSPSTNNHVRSRSIQKLISDHYLIHEQNNMININDTDQMKLHDIENSIRSDIRLRKTKYQDLNKSRYLKSFPCSSDSIESITSHVSSQVPYSEKHIMFGTKNEFYDEKLCKNMYDDVSKFGSSDKMSTILHNDDYKDNSEHRTDIDLEIFSATKNLADTENKSSQHSSKEYMNSGDSKKNNYEKKEEIYSSADYKIYRGNTSEISDQDLDYLSTLNFINEISLETLYKEIPCFNKLQADLELDNVKDLKTQMTNQRLEYRDTNDVELVTENIQFKFENNRLYDSHFETSSKNIEHFKFDTNINKSNFKKSLLLPKSLTVDKDSYANTSSKDFINFSVHKINTSYQKVDDELHPKNPFKVTQEIFSTEQEEKVIVSDNDNNEEKEEKEEKNINFFKSGYTSLAHCDKSFYSFSPSSPPSPAPHDSNRSFNEECNNDINYIDESMNNTFNKSCEEERLWNEIQLFSKQKLYSKKKCLQNNQIGKETNYDNFDNSSDQVSTESNKNYSIISPIDKKIFPSRLENVDSDNIHFTFPEIFNTYSASDSNSVSVIRSRLSLTVDKLSTTYDAINFVPPPAPEEDNIGFSNDSNKKIKKNKKSFTMINSEDDYQVLDSKSLRNKESLKKSTYNSITDALTYYPSNEFWRSSSYLEHNLNQEKYDEMKNPIHSNDYFAKQKVFDTKDDDQTPPYGINMGQSPIKIYKNQISLNLDEKASSLIDLKHNDVCQLNIEKENYLEFDKASSKDLEYSNLTAEHDKYENYHPNIIISQSGYLSISTDIKDKIPDSNRKKLKRNQSIKKAVTSMSSWLNDFNLTKKQSDQMISRTISHDVSQSNTIGIKPISKIIPIKKRSKKKQGIQKRKKNLVTSVSGIIQKAKFPYHSQALLTLEQPQLDPYPEYPKNSVMIDNKKAEPEKSMNMLTFQKNSESNQLLKLNKDKRTPEYDNTKLLVKQTSFDQEHQAIIGEKTFVSDQFRSTESKLDQSNDENYLNLMENNEKQQFENFIEKKPPCNQDDIIFATVGDIRKSLDVDENSENQLIQPSHLKSSTTMEFAVSRALGKYRRKQYSSESNNNNIDSHLPIEKGENYGSNSRSFESSSSFENSQSTSEVKPNSFDDNSFQENLSSNVLKGNNQIAVRFSSKQQSSLEIPSVSIRAGEGDDDNKSTHSYRSTSRVSSRRQSTEESIDSEDEWYCYELKKLEELERLSEVQNEIQSVLIDDTLEPNSVIKERMSLVFEELKLRTCVVEEYNSSTSMIVENSHKITSNDHLLNSQPLFAKITDYQSWVREEKNIDEEKIISIEDESSGETSGPDSAIISIEEDEESFRKDSEKMHFSLCKTDSNKDRNTINSFDLENSNREDLHLETEHKDVTEKDSNLNKSESQESPEASASKWKLLKALKERKAEDRLKEKEDFMKEVSSDLKVKHFVSSNYRILFRNY
ncbi:hypothetical protein TKK_0002888 [Trichogramma kaykai]|uniref:Uncharacterized protein n=1 Tax=Trichogramma kaykai TaxID=54128 RepID=A0ABD2XR87_9HYME